MKKPDEIKAKTEVSQIQSGRREIDETKLLNSQARIKAFVSSY